MQTRQVLLLAAGLLVLLLLGIGGMMYDRGARIEQELEADQITLPEVRDSGPLSVEQALWQRKSRRQFAQAPLSMSQVAQLLWAAQGVHDSQGKRTCPSAGALYPLEVLLVAGQVEGLEPGVYRYLPSAHALQPMQAGDMRASLAQAALGQGWMADAPITIVITAVYERTTHKYGERGVRYVHMEVGAAAENVYLQTEALELGTVFVGAFSDQRVQRLLGLQPEELPLALLPVGGR